MKKIDRANQIVIYTRESVYLYALMSGYEHLMRLFVSVRCLFLLFFFVFFFSNLHFDLRLQGVSRGCETDRRSINILINNSIMMTVIIMVITIANNKQDI